LAEAAEQGCGGFVGGVLEDELAAEGPCQQALVEPVEQARGAGGLVGQTVDGDEGGLDATDDFALFGEGRKRDRGCEDVVSADARQVATSRPADDMIDEHLTVDGLPGEPLIRLDQPTDKNNLRKHGRAAMLMLI
jgi:hypothetical protein